MPAKTLNIARGLKLPLEMATEALGVIATRGAGKTYTSAVLIEEMFKAGVQLGVIDPMGVYWGLRAGADGDKQGGLEIIVLGGTHGDAPLEPTAGALIADLLVDTGQSFVLDISEWSKGEQTRFMLNFCERLYQRKATDKRVLHLVIDEADEFAPERPLRDEAVMLAAVSRIVKRGRTRGIGVTLISQRTQAISKSVLDLIETLFVMRMLSPRGHTAVAGWITAKEERDDLGIIESLPHLPTGTGWLWSPMRGTLEKVAVRRIKTFDSYETPKSGEVKAEPRAVVDIDLTKLGKQIAATVERAKENDPTALRAEIKKLRGELAERPSEERIVEKQVEVKVEVPVLTAKQLLDATTLVNRATKLGERLAGLLEKLDYDPLREMIGQLADALLPINQAIGKVAGNPENVGKSTLRAPTPARTPDPPPADHEPHTHLARPEPERRQTPAPASANGGSSLKLAERKILAALAQYPQGRTVRQIAVQTGYAHKGGGFRNALGTLRRLHFIEGSDLVRITEDGKAAGEWPALPTGRALLDHWLGQSQLKKAEREILLALYDVHPTRLSVEEVAERTGYEAKGGGFRNALGKLRTLELIEGRGEVKASDGFFEETVFT